MDMIASDNNAEVIVNILSAVLANINHLSCRVIDTFERYEEVSYELQEAILDA